MNFVHFPFPFILVNAFAMHLSPPKYIRTNSHEFAHARTHTHTHTHTQARAQADALTCLRTRRPLNSGAADLGTAPPALAPASAPAAAPSSSRLCCCPPHEHPGTQPCGVRVGMGERGHMQAYPTSPWHTLVSPMHMAHGTWHMAHGRLPTHASAHTRMCTCVRMQAHTLPPASRNHMHVCICTCTFVYR